MTTICERAPGRLVDNDVYLITYRFELGDLTTRDTQANNIGLSMKWNNPKLQRPDLPDYNHIASQPCSSQGGDVEGQERSHASDLAALEHLADRYRVDVDVDVGDGDGKAVLAVQLAGWVLRFTAFWFLLEAFNVGGSVRNVLLGSDAIARIAGHCPAAGRSRDRRHKFLSSHVLGMREVRESPCSSAAP